MLACRLGRGRGVLRPRGCAFPHSSAGANQRQPAFPHNVGDTDGPQRMSVFGDERIELAKQVVLVMDEMPTKARYFLDNGTLLGLWRDGELIDNDDDFVSPCRCALCLVFGRLACSGSS